MYTKQEALIRSFTFSQKANQIRTKLLLQAQREVITYTNNRTKINSESSEGFLSKYESIEIVLMNPLEIGNSSQNSLDASNDSFFNKKTISSHEISEEVTLFVENLNRKLCSERKLLNVNQNLQLSNSKPDTSEKIKTNEKSIKRKNISLIKKSCNYLRKLSLNFIKRNRKSGLQKSSNRKKFTQPPKMSFDIFYQAYKCGKLKNNTQKHSSGLKFNLNDVIFDKNVVLINKKNSKQPKTTRSKNTFRPKMNNSIKENISSRSMRFDSVGLNNSRITNNKERLDGIKLNKLKNVPFGIKEDVNDINKKNDYVDGIYDYDTLRSRVFSKQKKKICANLDRNRKLSG